MSFSAQSRVLLKKGMGFGVYPSGIGGYCGAGTSCHVSARSVERCTLTPKLPWFKRARRLPFRGSCIVSVTLSPTNVARLMDHFEAPRSTVNSPFLVDT